jgi:hypothetical protein
MSSVFGASEKTPFLEFDAGKEAPSLAAFAGWQYPSLSCGLDRHQLLQLSTQDIFTHRPVLVTFGASLVVVVGVVWAVVLAWNMGINIVL